MIGIVQADADKFACAGNTRAKAGIAAHGSRVRVELGQLLQLRRRKRRNLKGR